MIEIPRSLLRQFRLALKRSFPPRCRPEQQLWVIIEAGKGKLTIHAQHTDAGISFQLPAHHAPAVMCLPAQALDEAAGRTGSVTLERSPDKVIARWDEQGIPRVVEYDTTDLAKLSPFPTSPTSFVANPPTILKALDDAMHCAAVENVRYATSKVQLRGNGEIVGTDGRQLLIQKGFHFPWKDHVLVPRMSLFGAGVLPEDVPGQVGRTSTHVFLQAGDWTVALTADTEGRFPKAEEAVPKAARTTWVLSTEDAAILVRTLPRLPGDKDDNAPVTIDLNGKGVIRARAAGQSRLTELTVEQSRVTGPPLRLAANRHLLLRALQLGFRELRLVDADTPVVAQDRDRTFVFMPLPKESVLLPSADAVRIVPQSEHPLPSSRPMMRRKNVMTIPISRNSTPSAPPPSATVKPSPNDDIAVLVAEAESLQGLLRDALGRAGRLLVAVRQQRRQSKIVHSALSSLRQLQQQQA